jgi:hypothetical protein
VLTVSNKTRCLVALLGVVGITSQSHAAPEAITARVVTGDQRPSCKYLGLVTATASAMGRDKPGRALEHALRKAQDMGGDGLFLINQTQNAFDGASVSGEALLCAAGVTAKP